jgi:hypothetical protein
MDNAQQYWYHTYQILVPQEGDVPIITPTCSEYKEIDKIINCTQRQSLRVHLAPIQRSLYKYINDTEAKINLLIPESRNIPRAKSVTKRALLPFLGQISKGLFGTATTEDLKVLQDHMMAMVKEQNKVVHAFTHDKHQMSSYMTSVNNRLSIAMEGVKENRALLEQINDEISKSLTTLDNGWATMINLIISYSNSANEIRHVMSDVYLGVQDLARFRLSPMLIPVDTISESLQQIKHHLHKRFPGFHVVHKDPNFYYNMKTVRYSRSKNSIFVTLKMPVSSSKSLFNLFQVYSVPVPLNESTGHATKLMEYPPYVALTENRKVYIEIDHSQYLQCQGRQVKHCPHALPQQSTSSLTCVTAILLQQHARVREICDFRFMLNGTIPMAIELEAGKFIISQVKSIRIVCDNEISLRPGCQYCIIHVPCQCHLQADSLQFPPRISKCVNETTDITMVYPVNLALLQQFFAPNELNNISGDSFFHNPLQFQIPEFKLFKHNFSDLVAADAKAHLSLKRMATAAKASEKIYQTMADPMLDEGWLDTESSVWDPIKEWAGAVALGLSAIALLGVVILVSRLRHMALTVGVLAASVQQAKAIQDPSKFSLVWKAPAQTKGPQTKELGQLKLDLNHHLLMIILSIMVVGLIIYMICKGVKLYRLWVGSHSKTAMFLELCDTVSCVRLKVVNLASSPKVWMLVGLEYIGEVKMLKACPWGTLGINWNDIKLRNNQTGVEMPLPKEISVSMLQLASVRQILGSKDFQAYVGFASGDLLRYIKVQQPDKEEMIIDNEGCKTCPSCPSCDSDMFV